MTKRVEGIIPPLTTPFTADGQVYVKGLRELVDFQCAAGAHGLFICGTYGSGPIMTLAQRKQVHEVVVDQAAGRLTVIAHVGTPSTAQSVELAQHAQSVGADAVASIPPYYHSHDELDVAAYMTALVGAVDLPVFIYNNPKTSGFNVTPKFLRQLAGLGVAGVKDSNFRYIDFTHMVLAMEDAPGFQFVVGTEGFALAGWMAGAQGCVSGLANVFPELMVELWEAYKAGAYDKAASLQMRVNKARQILHIPSSTNAACYAVLKARGVDGGFPIAPILWVTAESEKKMLAAYAEMGLL